MVSCMEETQKIPSAFIWRRLHSLTGIWLTLFLIEHLFVNSQAALFFGEDGSGFVDAVNSIKNLPYLPIIEILLLGVPIVVHAIWGIIYIRTGKMNSFRSDGSTPSLSEYPRNQAYSWQRITSWILLILLTGHIIHMRFIEYPSSARMDGQKLYMVRLDHDSGLNTLASRLNVKLYDNAKIEQAKQEPLDKKASDDAIAAQQQTQHQDFIAALENRPLAAGQVVAVAPDFGTAELLMVRESFKMPIMIALYTIFVLSACYHGFNGLWTFLITWGVTLTVHSQKLMRRVSTFLMIVIAFLGLAAIWGTYWINLKQ